MKINLLIIFFFITSIHPLFSQKINTVEYRSSITFYILPAKLVEASGLIFYKNLMWTFNDSGGKPVLYGFSNNDGIIHSKIKLKKGKNFDWEDITQDDNFIYVGDFGNNLGNRKNLRIFKVDKKSILGKRRQKIDFERIDFSYEDQKTFKLKLDQSSFDCETIIYYNDSLLLFTKDWLNFNTSVYKLPASQGQYAAKKITTININGLITGGSLLNEKTIILCGRDTIAPFIAIIDINNWQLINKIHFPLLKGFQIEGIYIEDENVYLQSEKTYYSQRVFIVPLQNLIQTF